MRSDSVQNISGLFSIVTNPEEDFAPMDNEVQFPASEITHLRTPSYIRPLHSFSEKQFIEKEKQLLLSADFLHSVDTYLTALQKFSHNPCDSYAFNEVKRIHRLYKISRKPLFPISINSGSHHYPFPLYCKDPDVARYLVVRSPQYFKGTFSLGVDGNKKNKS